MRRVIVWFVGAVLCSLLSGTTRADQDVQKKSTVTIRPERDDALLLNPGKGYVQYYGADESYTRDFISVGYTRWPWADIEPDEGRYNWKAIDDFVAGFKRYGKKAAFGVMSVSTGIGREYVTPKWVFEAGADPLAIPDGSSSTGKQVIPRHWDDPVFLAKLRKFITALGGRYNGNKDLAFVDVRDYGNWGEGHIGMLGNDPNIILTSSANLQKNYFEPYVAAFPSTQLIIPWGFSGYDAVYDWAVSRGAGMRRDGILSQYSKDGSECLRAFDHSPAVFEYCDSYENTKKSGYWSTNSLLRYVAAGRPSYMQWDPQIYQENKEFCKALGNKVGYHIVLTEASVAKSVRRLRPVNLAFKWLNDGVAYLYEPCYPSIALLDSAGNVVERQWLDASAPRHWAPGQITTEQLSVKFNAARAGIYKLAVGLFDSRESNVPIYCIGNKGRTAGGWYVLLDGFRLGK